MKFVTYLWVSRGFEFDFLLARQTGVWQKFLKEAGYKVWKVPIRASTLRPGTGGGAFPAKQGPRVLGGEWVVAVKVPSLVRFTP